jgi:hypothetical protein
MSNLLLLLGAGVVAVLAWRVLSRANELFYLTCEHGQATLRRGRIPPALLREIQDIAVRSKLEKAVIRCVVEDAKPRVLPHESLSESALQQLRNVVGQFDLRQIRSGRRN